MLLTKSLYACIRSPPEETALIDHMPLTLLYLRNSFPKAGVIISGDRNDLSIARLKSIVPALNQTVLQGTRGMNIGTSVRRSSGRRSGVAVRAVDCWQ